MSFKVGDAVGDYEVVGVLGAGGMGRVYKVRNMLSNRFEAMKVLLQEALGTADQSERFLREIRVQASLEHPNIAALRTAMRIENQLVMIIELVEGKTLQAMLESGAFPPQTAIDYISQALSALSYAHERGVIHRDIKPANLMLTKDGVIKLTDFGLAKVGVDRSLTKTGTTMGSIYYMSPEQVSGSGALDARSDLYSLGVTLYEAVTGTRPFQGEHDYAIFSAHLNDAPVPPREKNPNVSPELNEIILKSLAKNPAERFQTAAAFRQALESLEGLPKQAEATRPMAALDAPVSAAGRGASAPQPAATRPSGSTPVSSSTLEMAYVLFMDIVAYSTLPMDRQTERITTLAEIVRGTDEFRRAQGADQLVSLPTGDGMALVFFQNPIAPVQCAMQVTHTLRSHPELKLRMGIHSGPVYRIADINTNRNVAGGGINMAQRVMDCGDAGHILVSKMVADTLGQLSDWAEHFHDLGEAEVKHGVKVQIVNFYTGEVGNPEVPHKLCSAITVPGQIQPPALAMVPARGRAMVQAPPMALATRRKAVVWVAGGGGILAVVLLAFGATPFSYWRATSQDKNPGTAAAQGQSGTSTATPARPPSGTTSTVPPSGSTAPSQTSGASLAPSQVVPGTRKLGQLSQAPTEQRGSEPQEAQEAAGSAEKDLQELRERMIMLAGRAAALRGSLDNLQRQQSAAGLGLRPDMAAARESMDYLMEEAKASLRARDAAATKRNLDLAEQQVEKLERFLGR
ncbi:MAG: protein kinase [Acidobacteria bacterium]|nr:protein kinase [Acidobacteriota bacterium]